MAPQQIPALSVYVGRRARYAVAAGLIQVGLLSVKRRTLRCNKTRAARRAWCGVEGANATQDATHMDGAARERRKPANYRLRFTDTKSVFADCAARQTGAGEHDGPVIAVVLAERGTSPIF